MGSTYSRPKGSMPRQITSQASAKVILGLGAMGAGES